MLLLSLYLDAVAVVVDDATDYVLDLLTGVIVVVVVVVMVDVPDYVPVILP